MPILTTLSRIGALALLLLSAPPVFAQNGVMPAPVAIAESGEDALYTVRDVAVDVTAASAAAARDKAIFDGQRAALAQLLERIGADSGFDPAKIDNGKITRLVRNFEITNEKSSRVRYIAKLDVSFRPQAVRNLLDGAGAHYMTTASRPVIVLPVSGVDKRAVLWEERTPWRNACESLLRTESLTPVIIPSGEMSDISAISADDALAGNAKAIEAIAANYNAEFVLVAAFPGGETDPANPLTVIVSRYDANGDNQGQNGLAIPAAPTHEAQLAAAVAQLDKLIKQYRAGTAPIAGHTDGGAAPVFDGQENTLPVHASLASLPELTRLRQRLGAVPLIRRADVTSIKNGGANLQLAFQGNIEQLTEALAQQGLTIGQTPEGVWQLQER
ncbi:MAG: DUF2066 domain-containing protein [Alphaproteobacteria bacterium]